MFFCFFLQTVLFLGGGLKRDNWGRNERLVERTRKIISLSFNLKTRRHNQSQNCPLQETKKKKKASCECFTYLYNHHFQASKEYNCFTYLFWELLRLHEWLDTRGAAERFRWARWLLQWHCCCCCLASNMTMLLQLLLLATRTDGTWAWRDGLMGRCLEPVTY